MSEVLARGRRGGTFTVLGGISKLLIQLTGVVVLSRLLTPSDFGLVAMVAAFMALADLIRDFGMPTAALGARTLTQQQASNVFWMNTVLAFAVSLLLASAATPISLLYSEPRLMAIVPALAVAVAISGTQAQIQVALARQMRFLALTVTDVAAQLAGLVCAIVAALSGAGYWALVVQALAPPVVLLCTRWILVRWIPSLPRRGHGSKILFTSGLNYGAAYFLTYLASNVDTILIGSLWGADILGKYSRAFQMLTVPVGRIVEPLTQVVIPTLRSLQDDVDRLQSTVLRLQFGLGLPIVIGFAITGGAASALVPLALGPGWGQTSRIFQILAIGGCFWILSHINYWVFILGEHSRHLLFYNLATKPVAVVLIVAAAPFGAEYVAWAYATSMALSWPVGLFWLSRLGAVRMRPFVQQGLAMIAVACVAAFASAAASTLPPDLPDYGRVLLSAGVGLLFAAAGVVVVPALRDEAWTALRNSKISRTTL